MAKQSAQATHKPPVASEHPTPSSKSQSNPDVFAAVTLILCAVLAMVFWVSSQLPLALQA